MKILTAVGRLMFVTNICLHRGMWLAYWKHFPAGVTLFAYNCRYVGAFSWRGRFS